MKTVIIFDNRKCNRCGYTTNNMKETICKCGGYLYMMGGCYMPTVKKIQKGGN